jgi:hypothetical protein
MPAWVANVSVVLALVLSAFNLWDKLDAKKKALKAPTEAMMSRLESVEKKLEQYDDYFRRDLRRIEILEEGNRVTQKALLALMSHAIDGNDIERLRKAKDDLNEYLINR